MAKKWVKPHGMFTEEVIWRSVIALLSSEDRLVEAHNICHALDSLFVLQRINPNEYVYLKKKLFAFRPRPEQELGQPFWGMGDVKSRVLFVRKMIKLITEKKGGKNARKMGKA